MARKAKSNLSKHGQEEVVFVSRGTRSSQPIFSDLSRNFYLTLSLNGHPFIAGAEPVGAKSKFDYGRTAVMVGDYFADPLFGAYEYYKVKEIETTFTWMSPPSNGLINGALYTSVDKDSVEAESLVNYTNRVNLVKQCFTNTKPSLSVVYQPHMVNFAEDDSENGVQYVQPTDRWWNCDQFRNHRWGCLRFVVANQGIDAYEHDASVLVTHKVTICVKGQKDVVAPMAPPDPSEIAHQNRSTLPDWALE